LSVNGGHKSVGVLAYNIYSNNFVMLIISLFLLEDEPVLCIPFIMIGMIFSILCTYGMWNVEWATTASNGTLVIQSTNAYGEPYSYVFYWIFIIFLALFVKAGFNTWREAIKNKEQMKIQDRTRYR